MESRNTLLYSASAALLLLLATCAQTCPMPGCKTTTSCELKNYLSTNHNISTEVRASVRLDGILNQPFADNSYNRAFTDFGAISLSYRLKEVPVGNETQPCHLDNPAGERCAYKLVAKPGFQCGFEYHCDFNRNRIPQYIWRAECLPPPPGLISVPVYYKVPVLELNSNPDSCNPFDKSTYQGGWTWRQLSVPVACTCRNTTSP